MSNSPVQNRDNDNVSLPACGVIGEAVPLPAIHLRRIRPAVAASTALHRVESLCCSNCRPLHLCIILSAAAARNGARAEILASHSHSTGPGGDKAARGTDPDGPCPPGMYTCRPFACSLLHAELQPFPPLPMCTARTTKTIPKMVLAPRMLRSGTLALANPSSATLLFLLVDPWDYTAPTPALQLPLQARLTIHDSVVNPHPVYAAEKRCVSPPPNAEFASSPACSLLNFCVCDDAGVDPGTRVPP
ncbi:hypothetical protein B0J11DRAFT_507544 [Dendryphion nanum]|uniref:Uncharacterized protein n=1 Tax=Dendryphion nanum TaxID=256645 RepID=A0A9P9IJ82_9PLEO|nr:hypothetical protein B0J11DRAFT_507544 [Dendryphion nanum]